MHTLRNALGSIWVAAALILTGCDGGGGGGGAGDGHDFGDNDPMVVVAVGDSITTGSYPSQLAGMIGKTVINRGVDGSTASEGAGRIEGTLSSVKPGYALILYGANDVIRGLNKDRTVGSLGAIIEVCKAHKTIPIIATLTPMVASHTIFNGSARNLSERIRTLASQSGAELCDLESAFSGNAEGLLQSDGLHPNREGDLVIADTFAEKF